MHVAVVIVGFRNPGDVLACLAALSRSEYADFEVMICENGGEEAYRRLVSAAPQKLVGGQPVRIIDAGGNVGYAGGVNICLKACPDADAWWVLNPDAEPECRALGALLKRLSEGDCEAVGCTVLLGDGSVQSHGGLWQRLIGRAVSIGNGSRMEQRAKVETIERRQNYLNGACMLVGRRFLERVGLMREDYFLYCEEVEWCLRGLQRGMRLGFAADAIVMHHQGTTTGHVTDIRSRPRTPVYLNERNKLLLTRDCFWWLLPAVALMAVCNIVARYGRRRAWRQLSYALEGWAAGLAGRRGKPAWIG